MSSANEVDHASVLLHIIRTAAAGEVNWTVFSSTFVDYYHFFSPPDLVCDEPTERLFEDVNDLTEWTAADPTAEDIEVGYRTEAEALNELRALLRRYDSRPLA